MRVALAYRSFELTGSLARETVELARHLSRRHEVHVFAIPSRTDASLAPDCIFHPVPVRHVGDGRRFSARELVSYARSAAKLLSEERFDVVHACAPSTWATDVLHVPGIARAEAALEDVPGWRYWAQAVRRPGDAARRLLERKALAHSGLRRLHAAAPSVADALERHYGFDSAEILVVPPAVSLEAFLPPLDKAAARAEIGMEDGERLVVLFCGSDFRRKGLDRAIVALANTDVNAILLVVGGGSDGPYRKLAGELGVADRVRFVGLREDAWRFYQASDVVLLPTRADVWGITPLEGLACGVPPIVTSAAGSASAIRNGETGVVLPEPFEPKALVAAIELLAKDDALRAAMGAAGLDDARQHSTVTRNTRVENDLVAIAEGRVASVRRRRRRGSGDSAAV